MSLLYLTGSGYNQIARVATAPVPGGSTSGYSVTAIYNGVANEPFIFSGAASTSYIDFDMNQVTNPGFETAFTGGLPAAATAIATWSKLTGCTLTRDTGVFLSGVASMRVDGSGVGPSGGFGAAYFDQAVSAGEVLNVTGSAQVAVTGTAKMRCQNLATGMWLNSSFQWQSASTSWGSGGTSFITSSGTFTVEDFEACQVDRPTLRWTLSQEAVAVVPAYFDDFYVYPRVDFAFIHNHNFPTACTVELKSSASSPASSLAGTFTISQPTMFLHGFTARDHLYWRLISSDPPDLRAPYMWQLVLGQATSLRRGQNYGQSITLTDPQDRSDAGLGPIQAFIRTSHGRRKVDMQFRYNDSDDFAQAKEIMERSRNGAYPLVVVVERADPTSAVLCRVGMDWASSRTTNLVRDSSFSLDELPFGVVVP